MGLFEENSRRLARLKNTRPVHGKIRQILKDGKREQLLQGVDWKGRKFAPLKASTLKRRKGNGPPLVPKPDSRFITHYYVIVDQAGPGQVSIEADWSLSFSRYHNTGTKHMVARPPGGFRSKDTKAVAVALRDWIMNGKA